MYPTDWKLREVEILRLLAKGLTNSEIAGQLHLSHETVRWYNKQIFQKLNVGNRVQAARRAAELHLLDAPDGAEPHQPTPHRARSPVNYIANGDVSIAYQVIGNGPVDLLFIHGFLSHLELAWENAEFTQFFERLGRTMRVILFDKRGVGLSDRIHGAPTIEQTIEDIHCVLDAVGSTRAFIMGTSEGGAASVLLAATYPERVQGLILFGATPKVVRTGDEPAWAVTKERWARMIEDMQRSWGGPWAIEGFAPSRARDAQFRSWWSKVLRSASSPSNIKAVMDLTAEVDIRALLPQARVKTLVIHKRDDRMVSIAEGKYFATHMPNATWLELPGADHIYFIESDALLHAIEQFCANPTSTSSDSRMEIILNATVATVTEPLAQANGLRAKITAYAPRHAWQTQDGALALFDSPNRAIQCALGLRGMDKLGSLRIGLHVGECSVADGAPRGSALNVAEGAARLGLPGEIVVTQTLRDILAGTDFVLEARQPHGANSVPPDIALFTLM